MPATMEDPPVRLAASRFVTIDLAALITGYSEKAIRRKMEDGVWLEKKVWVRAPDGRCLIDIRGYERWAAGDQA